MRQGSPAACDSSGETPRATGTRRRPPRGVTDRHAACLSWGWAL